MQIVFKECMTCILSGRCIKKTYKWLIILDEEQEDSHDQQHKDPQNSDRLVSSPVKVIISTRTSCWQHLTKDQNFKAHFLTKISLGTF